MFKESKAEKLDLSSFDTRKVTSIGSMFAFSNITTNVVKEQPKQEAPKVQVETPVAPTVAQEVIKADDIDAILNSAPKVQQETPKMEQPKVVNPIADMSDDDLINSILNGN